jgi:phage gpG-like protein
MPNGLELTAKVSGTKELRRQLERMNPGVNKRIVNAALKESMLKTLSNSASKAIKRGGSDKPKASILTSRTGTLRRSLGSSFALDRSRLPFYIEGGTNLVYGAVHESGGTFNVKASRVSAHTRKVKGIGTPVAVKSHTRNAHQVTFPKRAFLAPGLKMTEREFPAIFEFWWNREGLS